MGPAAMAVALCDCRCPAVKVQFCRTSCRRPNATIAAFCKTSINRFQARKAETDYIATLTVRHMEQTLEGLVNKRMR